jgi:tyrosyl-tRNA synthetase
MGKTAAGAVWLNADMRSPYEYWQFWRNTEDADVGRFLRLFTTLPLSEVAKLEGLSGAEINDAKKALANAATAVVHGSEAAQAASDTARKTFEEGTSAEGLPTIMVDLEKGVGLLQASVLAGLAGSNGEARRSVQGGGVRVNDVPAGDERMVLNRSHLNGDGVIKLSLGRKKHVLLKPL